MFSLEHWRQLWGQKWRQIPKVVFLSQKKAFYINDLYLLFASAPPTPASLQKPENASRNGYAALQDNARQLIWLISIKDVIWKDILPTSIRVFVVKKEKSAIVLFVKDEAHDIMAWLSWHISLGFNKIFVYDDHSTDGTYEIAKSCEGIYNVEVCRTSMLEGNFYYRQRDSYFDAIKKSIDHYEWIAMLDGDEYVSIDGTQDINGFLDKFSKDDTGIALGSGPIDMSGRM